jgi:phosphoglycolate phosphatase
VTDQPVDELAQLLASTRCLLLDFDGPICAIFARRPAQTVVIDLVECLTVSGAAVPDAVATATDPFDVLRYAGTLSDQLAEQVEARMRASEIEAAGTARPTAHVAEVVQAWRTEGRQAAIVSNNSAAAVEAYLRDHHLDIDHVAARTSADPALLKPSPHLIKLAMQALDADAATCTLIGDSRTDITAARLAGIAAIGYANKPGKQTALTEAGADVVINDMQALIDAVTIPST